MNHAFDDIKNGYQNKDKNNLQRTTSVVKIKQMQNHDRSLLMRNIIFYLVLIIAAIGLVMNLDAFIFSIVRMLVSFAVIAGIIYLIYYFFILTEDQRKYRKAMRKYKRNQRRK